MVLISSGIASTDALTVANGAGVAVAYDGGLTTNGIFTNNGEFIIQSDAAGASGSFIDKNGISGTGSYNFNREYLGGEWHLISSPVSGATANMFIGLYLQNHTESTNLYSDIVDPSTPLNIMQGYALWNNLSSTASFIGTFNSGTFSKGATRDGLGWNLVGNPYPSPIDGIFYWLDENECR